ncbi:MAG: hypothetical protein IPN30_09655 [Flavobacteriales bacterium]|nr:hypothetical protein [Flavobacteriales bacterium]
MFTPTRLRILLIVFIAAITICCTASAIPGIRGDHIIRAASTFFAGLTSSAMIWLLMPKKTG